MALYWSGARVKVRYESDFGEDERDCPKDTIVIVMKPGQEDDPSYVRAVRHVVALRTLEGEMDRNEERAHDVEAAGEKDKEDERREDQAVLEAERRFVETFLSEGELDLGEALFGCADGLDGEEPLPLRDFLERGACGSCGCVDWPMCHPMQVVIEHCDEMVIGG